jgi:hypothetical protein
MSQKCRGLKSVSANLRLARFWSRPVHRAGHLQLLSSSIAASTTTIDIREH